jgi:hypothetical protein
LAIFSDRYNDDVPEKIFILDVEAIMKLIIN